MDKTMYFLINNYGKTLEAIYDNQVTIKNETYCPLTQVELAKLIGVSRNTMVVIIKKLYETELLKEINNSKKYILTNKGNEVIKLLKKNI